MVTDDINSGPSSLTSSSNSNRRVKYADTALAGDQMSRSSRTLIGQLCSSQRYSNVTMRNISSISHSGTNISAKAKLDSHADTTVAGSACRILELTEHSCDVFPFSNQYEPVQMYPSQRLQLPTITPRQVKHLFWSSVRHYIWETVLIIHSFVQTKYVTMESLLMTSHAICLTIENPRTPYISQMRTSTCL
jgi:hypothetical protein